MQRCFFETEDGTVLWDGRIMPPNQAMWAALGDPEEGNIWRHLAIIKHFARGYWFQPTHPKNTTGLLEPLRFPLRKLYLDRIRSDYDAAPLREDSARKAIETVEALLQGIRERRREG